MIRIGCSDYDNGKLPGIVNAGIALSTCSGLV
jgi:hypothetical protein